MIDSQLLGCIGEDRLPVRPHVHDGPALITGRVQCGIQPPHVRLAIVGVLPLGVGVMDDQAEAGTFAGGRPLEHLEVAVGVAEGHHGSAADVQIDVDRLALLVVDAADLRQFQQDRDSVPHFKLRVGGGCGPGDEPFVNEMKDKMRAAKCLKDVEWYPNLSRGDKLAFFRQLTVFCTPATYGESFGLYLVEAMAAGIPPVQPRLGAFPEIIEAVGGTPTLQLRATATMNIE